MIDRNLMLVLAGVCVSLFFGWVVFPTVLYESMDQPVQFSHAIHTGDAVGLKCEDCHAFREEGRFAGIPKLEQCAACHQEAVGSTENEKRFVENFVKTGREVPWLVYARQPENAYFSHVTHTKVGNLPCERCHGPHGSSAQLRPFERNRISGYSRDIWGASMARIKYQPWQGMKMDDCIDCHNKTQERKACLDCHK